jgi:HlyD family secretion protein
MKKIIRFLLGIALLALFVWTLLFLYKKSESKPVQYQTAQPFYTDIIKKSVATGAVVPRREIAIKPQVSGIIEKIFVVAGDRVQKGDVIARIRIIPNMLALNSAESRLNRARIALENAKMEYDRNLPLYQNKVISQAEWQPVTANYNNAKEEFESAENNLQLIREGVTKAPGQGSNTIVRSTLDGMVLDVPVKEGSSVIESNTFNEGTTIATIADMGEMIFEGKVDESEVGKIKPGMELILTIGAIDNEKFKARLEYIAPKGVKENGAIQFLIKARLQLKPGYFIRAGYSANADIVLERRDSVLAIPEGLLQFEKEQAYVEVEKSLQQFEKRKPKLGVSDGINVEVLEGLSLNDRIKDPNANKAASAEVESNE